MEAGRLRQPQNTGQFSQFSFSVFDNLNLQLQQANTKIEVQETEIRRLAKAEEDLHNNIRKELDEKEKLLMEKLQAESNVNDYRELNENQKAQLAQQSVRVRLI